MTEEQETFTVTEKVLLTSLNAQIAIKNIRNMLSDYLDDEITKEKVADDDLHVFIRDLLTQGARI